MLPVAALRVPPFADLYPLSSMASDPLVSADTSSSSVLARHKTKWMWMAPVGLVGIGLGASAVGRATTKWAQGKPYFWHGTFALVCLNASLSVFADAVKHRALYEMKGGR